jgi:hypothetical protein
MTIRFALLLLLVLPLAPAGCSGDRRPTTIAVTGRISYEGRPLAAGAITFYPDDAQKETTTRPALGVIDEQGRYSLSTFRTGDGAMPGAYRVSIESLSNERSIERPDARETWAIPEKYGRADTSGLVATVPADRRGVMVIDFDLKP